MPGAGDRTVLRDQLFQQWNERFKRLEDGQGESHTLMQQILVNTAGLPELKKRHDNLEIRVDGLASDHDRFQGGVKVAGALGGGIMAAWEALRYFVLK